MKLRFKESEIRNLAAQYSSEMGEKDRRLTERITQEVLSSYARKGFLVKDEVLSVCSWKTSRSKPLCKSNDEHLIRDISAIAKTSSPMEHYLLVEASNGGGSCDKIAKGIKFTFDSYGSSHQNIL